jgi:hypothetical protein
MRKLLIAALAFAPLGAIYAQPEAPKTSGFAPLDYFSAKCARCHGPNGSFYGAKFGKGLKDDAALKDIVKAMCDGPGGAPLEEHDLEILTDFHRALRDGKPYLVAVELKDGVLSGEASPGAKITLESGTKIVEVKLEGNKWSLPVAADFVWKDAKLRAVKGEAETIVEL